MKRKKSDYPAVNEINALEKRTGVTIEDTLKRLFKDQSPEFLKDLRRNMRDCLSIDFEYATASPEQQKFWKTIIRDSKRMTDYTASDLDESIRAYTLLLRSYNTLAAWKESKQVYKPDPDFLDELRKTEGFEFSWDEVKQIPNTSFCVDFTECKMKPVRLVFVDLVPNLNKKNLEVTFQMILHSNSDTGASAQLSGILDFENGKTTIGKMCKDNPEFSASWGSVTNPVMENLRTLLVGSEKIGVDEKNVEVTRLDTLITMFQLTKFILSAEAKMDVKPSKLMERNYNPRKDGAKKDRIEVREVKEYDVGAYYGKAIRAYRDGEDGLKVFTDNAKVELTGKDGHSGKNVRPHIRRPHWHTYLTGKDRKIPVVHWLNRIYVNVKSGEISSRVTPIEMAFESNGKSKTNDLGLN